MDLTENLILDSVKIEKRTPEPCLIQVDCTIPADKVSEAYNKVTKEFAKHVKMAGFRPGKAPVSIVKTTHKKNIDEETLKELISVSIRKFIKEEKEEVLNYSFAKDKKPELKLGSDFTFGVRFNIAPEFEVPNYKGILVQIEKNETTDTQVEERIKFFREAYGKFEKVEDGAKEGDMLKVSYTSDAVLPEDAKDNVKRMVKSDMNYFWVNSNNMIPGVDKAIIGAKNNDEIKFKAEFPSDYDEAALAGKVVNYDIKVIEVQRKAIIFSDEELYKKFGFESMDEMRAGIKRQLEKEAEKNDKLEKRTKVIEAITKDLGFPVPPDILQDETANELNMIINATMSHAKDQSLAKKELEENREALMNEAKEKAIKKLRNFLLLRKIGKIESISVEEHEVEKHIESISYHYGYKADDLKKRLVSSGNINQVFDDVLINKVTDFIVENANTEYITKNA